MLLWHHAPAPRPAAGTILAAGRVELVQRVVAGVVVDGGGGGGGQEVAGAAVAATERVVALKSDREMQNRVSKIEVF